MRDSRDDIAARIEQRTNELLQHAAALCASHRARLPDPVIRFDLHGQAAGQMQWRRGARPVLRYNLDIAQHHHEDFLAQTVAHEVAHLITAACHGQTRPHGSEWRAVMRHLGIANPQRCHQYAVDETAVRRQRRWAYECNCRGHELSTTRHKRIQTGSSRYHCRQCGAALRPAGPSSD
jgi:SprT protein